MRCWFVTYQQALPDGSCLQGNALVEGAHPALWIRTLEDGVLLFFAELSDDDTALIKDADAAADAAEESPR